MTDPAAYYPAGRLVPVFAANESLQTAQTILALARQAASTGETVLMVDCQDGALMEHTGIIYNKTLGDVILRGAQISDAHYITSNEHFSAIAAGDATLDTVLGSLAALSLDYDWVFVATESGCSPAHVRLAGASDVSLMAYDTHADDFMRAYWMIDACRRRFPGFDPLLLSMGNPEDAAETAELLRGSIAEFLGAPPPYVGHAGTPQNISDIINTMMRGFALAA